MPRPCKGDPTECSCPRCDPPDPDVPAALDPEAPEDILPEQDYPDASDRWERTFHNG